MPESRTRKSVEEKRRLKAQRAMKDPRSKALASRRWVPPTFITVGLLGVALADHVLHRRAEHTVHERSRKLEHPDRDGPDGRRLRHSHPLEVGPYFRTRSWLHAAYVRRTIGMTSL